jgi:DNA-binding protein HU-beta
LTGIAVAGNNKGLIGSDTARLYQNEPGSESVSDSYHIWRRLYTVTKAELITEVAKATGLNKKESGAAVGAVFEAIEAALEKGEKIQLVGFGTFEVRERAAREGRNPQDPKKVIKIPAKKIPVFRPGKALKDKVE